MSKVGKYIYGIINSNTPFRLFIPKVVLPQGEKEATEVVYTIPYQDISAIVTKSEIIDYTHMFKDTLVRLLVEHQKVIERIMGLKYTITPMRLGTFALDEEEVKDILSRGYGLIKEIFKKINEKIEIDVVAMWSDFSSAIREAGEGKEIKEFKEKLLSNPRGISVDDQMKVGIMVKKALDQIKDRYVSKIQNVLSTVCDCFKQHELMDDKMVANFAFLIDKTKEKEFYGKIENLNYEFKELLDFRCVGPLPPYSFYTLEIKKLQFQEIDWARKKLGILNDSIAKDEVKKTYYRLALSFHPDKNPNKPGTEKEFDEIKKSYNILLDYCQSCEQADQENLFFNEDEFKKNALLVKLRD